MNILFLFHAAVVDGRPQCASWIKSILTDLDDAFCVSLFAFGEEGFESTHIQIEQKQYPVLSMGAADDASLKRAIKDASPDAVILFGTEKPWTLRALKCCDELGMLDHAAVFAQGICAACARHYAEGLSARVINRYTFRDLLRRENIKKEQQSLYHRAADEKRAIELTRHFIGRTTLDQTFLELYHPQANYHHCDDILRDCFYDGKWKRDCCEDHRIFVSQYYYPLKGFHFLLEAAALLKKKYPDLKIAAAGYNPILRPLPQKELKDSSYIRYIKTLIAQKGLADNIELLGALDEEKMKEEYLKAHVFVLPSTIENSPNSLAEAMMLGVPSVASDVGGVADLAVHQKEAFLYPSSDVELLARCIDLVFRDEKTAQRLSDNGRARARKLYDRKTNIRTFENTLKEIAKKS